MKAERLLRVSISLNLEYAGMETMLVDCFSRRFDTVIKTNSHCHSRGIIIKYFSNAKLVVYELWAWTICGTSNRFRGVMRRYYAYVTWVCYCCYLPTLCWDCVHVLATWCVTTCITGHDRGTRKLHGIAAQTITATSKGRQTSPWLQDYLLCKHNMPYMAMCR